MSRTFPHRLFATDRALLLAAVACAVVGAALPWWNSHLGFGFGTTWLPGDCYLSYDGYSYCETGSVGVTTTTRVLGPVPGVAAPTRVWLALTGLLLVVAWRRRSVPAARLGLVVGVVTLFVGGVHLTSGRLLTAVALGLIALALTRRGVAWPPLRAGSGRPAQPPAARRS